MGRGWLECLARVASRWRLSYLVLFGSHARGYAGPHSDYDVAVKAGRKLGFRERGLLYTELEECVRGRLDLLFIDDWDPIAVWEALSSGRLVHHCGVPCIREYYDDLARAIDEVADLEYLLELFRREAKRASPGIIARVTRARRSLNRLRRLASMPWREYSVDEDAQALAERHLHILLESILDLAAFIAARRGLAWASTYRGIIKALVANGIVPAELRDLALLAAGMRNILVHGYAEVRHDVIHEVLRRDLDKLERLLIILWREAEALDP